MDGGQVCLGEVYGHQAYHLSTAQPQTCLWTGAAAWPRCRSEGPCSSSATRQPYSPPGRQENEYGSWERPRWLTSRGHNVLKIIWKIETVGYCQNKSIDWWSWDLTTCFKNYLGDISQISLFPIHFLHHGKGRGSQKSKTRCGLWTCVMKPR